jgi:DNA repair protein RecN (Recombination protein N)
MLEKIEIKNLGLISHAQLDLKPGLVVVTGETGAGKSLLFDAVRALAGAKPKLFNEFGDAAVTGELKVTSDELAKALEEVDAVVEDGYVQINRHFPLEGRSRSTLGGRSVPAAVLTEIADNWLVVHGQHDSQRLLVSSTHRIILDRFGGVELWRVLHQHAANFSALKAATKELKDAQKKQKEVAERAESLKADIALCQSLDIQVGEENEIAAKIERLSRIDEVRTSVDKAIDSLADDSTMIGIQAASRALENGMPSDANAIALAGRLNNLRNELADIVSSISQIRDELDIDSNEIDSLMMRSRQLKTLLLRHGPTTEDLLSWLEAAKIELQLVDPDSQYLTALEAKRKSAEVTADASASKLSALRQAAALQLASGVASELKALALPHAIFQVRQEAIELSEHGVDKIEFVFSANPGLPVSPIATAASGGELSRLMLALEVVLVESTDQFGPSVMLFDEVDAGVAGQAAISVAERLARLASKRQVLVVTHLPQLAAYADLHIVVDKDSDGMVTESFVKPLEALDRPRELSRMLAGLSDSASAVQHAEELLEKAKLWKASIIA